MNLITSTGASIENLGLPSAGSVETNPDYEAQQAEWIDDKLSQGCQLVLGRSVSEDGYRSNTDTQIWFDSESGMYAMQEVEHGVGAARSSVYIYIDEAERKALFAALHTMLSSHSKVESSQSFNFRFWDQRSESWVDAQRSFNSATMLIDLTRQPAQLETTDSAGVVA